MFSKQALQKLGSSGGGFAAYMTYVADSFRESIDNIKQRRSVAAAIIIFSTGAQALVLLLLLPLFISSELATWVSLALNTLLWTAVLIGWLLLHVSLIRDLSGAPIGLKLANQLTIFRFLLIPPILFLIGHDRPIAAMVLYVVCISSDVVDGMAARMRHEITVFGVVMDPLADIFSTAGVFAVLLSQGLLPVWVFLLLMVRYSILLAGTVIIFFKYGPLEFKATPVGKIVGVLQAFAVIMIVTYTVIEGDAGAVLGRYLYPLLGLLFSAVIVSQLLLGIRMIKSRTVRVGS
jgi:phosphatidylglycerophosphate synthase